MELFDPDWIHLSGVYGSNPRDKYIMLRCCIPHDFLVSNFMLVLTIYAYHYAYDYAYVYDYAYDYAYTFASPYASASTSRSYIPSGQSILYCST